MEFDPLILLIGEAAHEEFVFEEENSATVVIHVATSLQGGCYGRVVFASN